MTESGLAIAVIVAVGLAAANAPFLSERIFFVARPASGAKAFGWRLLEIIALYLVVGLGARAIEASAGAVYPQSWEFYAITFCLFIVFAYPGFVYRYMWQRGTAKDDE